MATLFHTNKSGWFPFYIADTAKSSLGFGTSTLEKVAPVKGLSLAALTKAFWLAKSFDVTVDATFSATETLPPHAHGGALGQAGTSTGTVSGTATVDLSSYVPGARCYDATSNFIFTQQTPSFPVNAGYLNIIPGFTGASTFTNAETGVVTPSSGPVLVSFAWFVPIVVASGWNKPFSMMVRDGNDFLTSLYFRCNPAPGVGFGGIEAGQFFEYIVDPSDFTTYPVIGDLTLIVGAESITLPLRGAPLPAFDDGTSSWSGSMTAAVTVNFNNFWA